MQTYTNNDSASVGRDSIRGYPSPFPLALQTPVSVTTTPCPSRCRNESRWTTSGKLRLLHTVPIRLATLDELPGTKRQTPDPAGPQPDCWSIDMLPCSLPCSLVVAKLPSVPEFQIWVSILLFAASCSWPVSLPSSSRPSPSLSWYIPCGCLCTGWRLRRSQATRYLDR